MTNKILFIIVSLALFSIFLTSQALAYAPKIQLIFTDPQNLCTDKADGETHLQFTYGYQANQDFQYFSKIITVEKNREYIYVPTPIELNYQSPYIYTAFEITSSGDCGNNDVDYSNYGDCYLVNLIPSQKTKIPFSYIITIMPQFTGISPYGAPSYNLLCHVQKI